MDTKPVLTFRIYQGANLVRQETVRQDIVKIGRDPKSHLRVDCELASRMHAVLEATSVKNLTLIDLGNQPGTLVNGKRINKCQLRAGDKIQIGTVTVELQSVGEKPASAAMEVAEAVPMWVPPAPPASPFALANNPFLPPVLAVPPSPVLAVEQSVLPGEYAMCKSGPSVHPEEVEDSSVTAIEVIVKWDSNVLHVEHLSPPRSFFVGESGDKGTPCDFLLPSDVVGAARVPVVIERAGGAWLVVPRGATGTIAMPNEARQELVAFVANGRARPSIEVSGATEIELLPGAKATMKLENSAIVFEVSAVNAGKKVAVGFLAGLEASAYKHVGMSLFAHLGIVASLAFFMPRMGADDANEIDRDRLLYMMHMLDQSAPPETDQTPEEANANDQATGGTGKRAEGAEGQMGKDTSRDTNKRYAIAGPADTSDPKLARARDLEEASTFGMISLVGTARNVPIAAWGETSPVGRDAKDFLGQMWGAEAGDAWGIGGLGLSGLEEGGGGKFHGIGMDGIDFGHGAGCIPTAGKPCGIGFGPGGEGIGHGYKPGRNHVPTAKAPREGNPTINGRLPAEVIQRIVRQNFGRFRNCYESGLRTNPTLQGRVAVKFVIARDGSVSIASDGGSDLPDQGIITCVTRNFMNLSFPQPEGGQVTVIYPIIFSPAD